MTIYVGELTSNVSGYTQAGFNYLMSLHEVGHPFGLFPIGDFVNWRSAPFWTEPLSISTGALGIPRDIAIVHHTPDSLPLAPNPCKRAFGLTTFETDRLSKWVINSLNKSGYEKLIVPSEFNKESLIESGLKLPISVIPHSIGDWWYKQTPEGIDADRPYTFIYSGAWNTRKNPEAVVRAFIKAFPKQTDEVCLMVKSASTKALDSKFSSLIGDRGDIFLYNEYFSEEQMRWFFNMGDCFVSAHRGEGFGLGPLQAKLLGLRVIYTNWSAPVEYCSNEQGDYPIPFKLVTANGYDQKHLHFESTDENSLKWAEPDEYALAVCMQEAFKNGRREIYELGWLKEFRETYSWKTVGKELLSQIK